MCVRTGVDRRCGGLPTPFGSIEGGQCLAIPALGKRKHPTGLVERRRRSRRR
jgi:hypothetical protein